MKIFQNYFFIKARVCDQCIDPGTFPFLIIDIFFAATKSKFYQKVFLERFTCVREYINVKTEMREVSVKNVQKNFNKKVYIKRTEKSKHSIFGKMIHLFKANYVVDQIYNNYLILHNFHYSSQ